MFIIPYKIIGNENGVFPPFLPGHPLPLFQEGGFLI